MLSPKEKATELFDKYYYYDSLLLDGISFRQAKQCALIAVDEIINSIVIIDLTTAKNQFIYWDEVKNEIEKI
jgi:hypothetical protein